MSTVFNMTGGAYYPDGDIIEYDENNPVKNEKVKTDGKNYKDIAGAINTKIKIPQKYTPEQMAPAIQSIITLEEGTVDATATSDEIFLDQIAYAQGVSIKGTFTIENEVSTQDTIIKTIESNLSGKSINPDPKTEQEKIVTPTEQQQIILPDDISKTLSKVIVESIPNNYIDENTLINRAEVGA